MMTSETRPADAPPATARTRGRRSPAGEVLTVLRHEFRHLLLSVRTLLPMVIYAGFGGLAMFAFNAVARRAQSEFDTRAAGEALPVDFEQATSEIVGQALALTGWGTTGDAAEMVRDHVPLLVVFFFALASYFLPLLVALVSFDQFSELSTRGARFALLRVRRLTYFIGKALAAVAAVAVFLLAMWLVVATVAVVRGGADAAPHAIRESLRAWALMCVLALPYLSLTAIVSSLVRPGLAFLGTFGVWMGLSVVGSILKYLSSSADESTSGAIAKGVLQLFPWEQAPKLISRDLPTLAQGVGGLVILAAIGYVVAAAVVRRRDV